MRSVYMNGVQNVCFTRSRAHTKTHRRSHKHIYSSNIHKQTTYYNICTISIKDGCARDATRQHISFVVVIYRKSHGRQTHTTCVQYSVEFSIECEGQLETIYATYTQTHDIRLLAG